MFRFAQCYWYFNWISNLAIWILLPFWTIADEDINDIPDLAFNLIIPYSKWFLSIYGWKRSVFQGESQNLNLPLGRVTLIVPEVCSISFFLIMRMI